MDIDLMREYIALATNLNFTTTAAQLFIMQSTLSRHLTRIETELGTQLLVRTTHNVVLTEKGKMVLEEFKKIVWLYDSLLKNTSSKYKSHICVDVLYYALDRYITPVLHMFKGLHPESQVILHTHQPLGIMDSLNSATADIGLLMRPEGSREAPYSGAECELKYHPFCRENLVCMLPSGDPLAAKSRLSLSDLKNIPIMFMVDHQWLNDYLEKCFREQGFAPRERRWTDHIDMLPISVLESGSAAIVPAHLEDMNRKNISFIPLNLDGCGIEFCLVHRAESDNPSIAAFIKTARQCYERR